MFVVGENWMIRITRAELAIVVAAGERKARRSGKRFVLDWSKIELVE
jgi:hypothetical protein